MSSSTDKNIWEPALSLWSWRHFLLAEFSTWQYCHGLWCTRRVPSELCHVCALWPSEDLNHHTLSTKPTIGQQVMLFLVFPCSELTIWVLYINISQLQHNYVWMMSSDTQYLHLEWIYCEEEWLSLIIYTTHSLIACLMSYLSFIWNALISVLFHKTHIYMLMPLQAATFPIIFIIIFKMMGMNMYMIGLFAEG